MRVGEARISIRFSAMAITVAITKSWISVEVSTSIPRFRLPEDAAMSPHHAGWDQRQTRSNDADNAKRRKWIDLADRVLGDGQEADPDAAARMCSTLSVSAWPIGAPLMIRSRLRLQCWQLSRNAAAARRSRTSAAGNRGYGQHLL